MLQIIRAVHTTLKMSDFIRFGYDVTDDADDFGDDLDAVRAASKWETVSRNATVFAIDVLNLSVIHSFEDPDSEENIENLFSLLL